MGIDNLFKTLEKSFYSEETKQMTKILCERLYIDFNSVIHMTINELEKDIRYLQYALLIKKIDDKCKQVILNYGIDFSYNNFDLNNSNWNDNNDDQYDQYDQYHEKFKQYLKQKFNDEYIFELIKKYIIRFLTNIVTGDDVKYIFISMDGMPSMAKIIEQKRRKVMSYLINGFKKKIFQESKSKIDDVRMTYENILYSFEKTKIYPMSPFMDKLYEYLTSKQFINEMKSQFKKIETINISGHTQNGEGEKKIMTDLIKMGVNNQKCVIFSPDSDAIILMVLIRNIINRTASLAINLQKTKNTIDIDLIRYNSSDDKYEYISANELCHKLYEYVKTRTSLTLDEDRVTNDICFIFTLLGNDFMPKIESINVKRDMEILLDVYVKTINNAYNSRHFGTYIIYQSKNKYRINYATFTKYLENIGSLEISLMKDSYIFHNYRNYKRIKSIFGKSSNTASKENVLYPKIILYLQFANVMFSVKKYYNDLKHQYSNSNSDSDSESKFCEASVTPFIQRELNKLLEHIDQKDIESSLSDLMEQFIKIEFKPEKMSQQDRNLINLETFNKLPINERINILIDIVIRIKNIDPSLRMIIDDQDIKCDFHQQNIIKQLPHPDIKITEYDEELYKMSRSIGKYKSYFSTNYEFGHFKFIASKGRQTSYTDNSIRRRYKYDTSIIHEDSQYYYSRYFGIDINDKSYQTINKINNIVIEYIKGLFWVFNYYMNNFDSKIDNWSWYYQFSHAPLLFHIVKYISIMSKLNKDKRDKWQWMDQIYNSVITPNNNEEIMTGREYYLYMNSHQSATNKFDEELLGKDINEKYKSLDHKKLFGDFDLVIESVWNGDNKYLDARNTYLSRAKLSNINILNYDSWKKILSDNNIYFNNNDNKELKEEKSLDKSLDQSNRQHQKAKYIIVQKDRLINHNYNNHKINIDAFINISPSTIKIDNISTNNNDIALTKSDSTISNSI